MSGCMYMVHGPVPTADRWRPDRPLPHVEACGVQRSAEDDVRAHVELARERLKLVGVGHPATSKSSRGESRRVEANRGKSRQIEASRGKSRCLSQVKQVKPNHATPSEAKPSDGMSSQAKSIQAWSSQANSSEVTCSGPAASSESPDLPGAPPAPPGAGHRVQRCGTGGCDAIQGTVVRWPAAARAPPRPRPSPARMRR